VVILNDSVDVKRYAALSRLAGVGEGVPDADGAPTVAVRCVVEAGDRGLKVKREARRRDPRGGHTILATLLLARRACSN